MKKWWCGTAERNAGRSTHIGLEEVVEHGEDEVLVQVLPHHRRQIVLSHLHTHTRGARRRLWWCGEMTVAQMSAHVNERAQQCAVVSKVIMLMIFRAQNTDTVCHVCHADTHANACPSAQTRARTHVGGLS